MKHSNEPIEADADIQAAQAAHSREQDIAAVWVKSVATLLSTKTARPSGRAVSIMRVAKNDCLVSDAVELRELERHQNE